MKSARIEVHLEDRESFLPVPRFEHAVAGFGEDVVRKQPDEGFIFDDENDNGFAIIHIGHELRPSKKRGLPVVRPGTPSGALQCGGEDGRSSHERQTDLTRNRLFPQKRFREIDSHPFRLRRITPPAVRSSPVFPRRRYRLATRRSGAAGADARAGEGT